MLKIDEIRSWLGVTIGRYSPPFSNYILFGSILTDAAPHDVDVIIVSEEWQVRGLCRNLKSEFRDKFGLPLHLQLFHISQTADIEAFIKRARLINEAL
jgi:hypothetical protein